MKIDLKNFKFKNSYVKMMYLRFLKLLKQNNLRAVPLYANGKIVAVFAME